MKKNTVPRLVVPHLRPKDGWENVLRRTQPHELMLCKDSNGIMVHVQFFVGYSATHLHILFDVTSPSRRAVHTADQAPVSTDSCVEVFIEPFPGADYWNFEVNCIGAINASHRKVRPEPTRLTPEELSQIKRKTSLGTKPFGEVEETSMWKAYVAVPFSALHIEKPKKGLKMRGNFYACASKSKYPYYMSWAPIADGKPDFHRPEYFGDIVLG